MMKKFRTLTNNNKPKKFSLITGKKIKATRKTGQINLLTGKPIKRKPKEVNKEIAKLVITKSLYVKGVIDIGFIPNHLIEVIDTFPFELQQFLNNTNILSVKSTAGLVIFKLEGNFEVIIKDITRNSRPKKLVTIKQGKKEILKHII